MRRDVFVGLGSLGLLGACTAPMQYLAFAVDAGEPSRAARWRYLRQDSGAISVVAAHLSMSTMTTPQRIRRMLPTAYVIV